MNIVKWGKPRLIDITNIDKFRKLWKRVCLYDDLKQIRENKN